MGSHSVLLSGASIGLAIAAPIGPMAVIVIRRTLAGGFLAGITTGAGASTVHLLYATFAVCGLDRLAISNHGNRDCLDVVTGLILLFFAVRLVRQRSTGTDTTVAPTRTLLMNYASAIAFNSLNPMTFALILAAVAGLLSVDPGTAGVLAIGVFLGSIVWWAALVITTATIGTRLSPRWIRSIDFLAAAIMLALAASTMSRLF